MVKIGYDANPLLPLWSVSVTDFVGDRPDEFHVCPVRALRFVLHRTQGLQPHPRSPFVSFVLILRSLPKITISFSFSEGSCVGLWFLILVPVPRPVPGLIVCAVRPLCLLS